ncbi:hypothetical protein [Bacillus mesophilum]|uniref:Uncharacterized protein n=1 Tax=Bacillus mesophilum TaxID=1071718 RepID=A0A7V7RPM4_9BACI|nr:hypothetical protein [Bacillus mesophilum]KAB2335143.1 hypothetical protein F7732_00820 [Bacillus mesophilum]
MQENKSEYKKMKSMFDNVQQDILLLEFQDILVEIYKELLESKKVAELEISSGQETAAATLSNEPNEE